MAEEEDDAQPECFATILTSFWWAVVTMTTVGYGDCYPSTPAGKTVSALTMMCGIVFIALPITIVGSNFQHLLDEHEAHAANFNKLDKDGNGLVSLDELSEFMIGAKRAGALNKNVISDLGAVEELMAKYDKDKEGALSMSEFNQLRTEVLTPEYLKKAIDPADKFRTEVVTELSQLRTDVTDRKSVV